MRFLPVTLVTPLTAVHQFVAVISRRLYTEQLLIRLPAQKKLATYILIFLTYTKAHGWAQAASPSATAATSLPRTFRAAKLSCHKSLSKVLDTPLRLHADDAPRTGKGNASWSRRWGRLGLARVPKLSHVFVCQKFLKNVAVCIFNKTSNFCATCNALQCSRRRFSSVSFLSFEILCHETFLACSDNKELGDVFIHVPALAIPSHTHTGTLTHREILLAS